MGKEVVPQRETKVNTKVLCPQNGKYILGKAHWSLLFSNFGITVYIVTISIGFFLPRNEQECLYSVAQAGFALVPLQWLRDLGFLF